MSDFTIVTYGGGEILKNVFNGIAILFNGGEADIVRPLCIITASIGGVWALMKAFFSPAIETLFVQYFLPLIAIPLLLMIPSTNVKIEDVIQDKSYEIDHVPLFLARVSQITSSIGYKLTTGIETVMHKPQDISYNRSGMIFGAETYLEMSQFKVTNATLEQNLNRFAKQCVFYDLALGLYSLDELKKTSDLWNFLKAHTSKVRMIHYFDPSKESKRGEYLSCQQTLDKISPYFEKEKKYYAQHELLKHLPLTYQTLTGLQNQSEELISQQLMINTLTKGLSSAGFAKSRADTQQKNTYQTLGALASSSIITIRSIVEALIYTSFLFIIPLSLIPGGIKYILSWLWLNVWIQLWPPFYAVINYIMVTASQTHAKTIFHGLSDDQIGLSMFTSVGLQSLHENIAATAGFLSMSVPFISYAILTGAQSFVQLATSLSAPSQSAASAAAAEQSTGNLSLANTSFGQNNYMNSSAYQSNTAPSLSSGYFSENTGNYSTTYAGSEAIVKQGNSDLRTSVFSDDSISQSLQHAYQSSQSQVTSSQNSFMESFSNSTRTMADLTEHLANSSNASTGLSQRDGFDVSESAKYFMGLSKSFGEQYGLSSRDSLDTLLGIGGSISPSIFGMGFGIKGDTSLAHGEGHDIVMNAAKNITSTEDFQKNYQKIQDLSANNSFSSLSDEGVRLVESYSKSIDQLTSSQHQYQSALSEMNQASQNLNWAESHSNLIKRSLNQDFVNWGSQYFQDEGGHTKLMETLTSGSDIEKESLINQFINTIRYETMDLMENYRDPYDSFSDSNISFLDKNQELESLREFISDASSSHNLSHGFTQSHLDGMQNSFNSEIQQHFKSTQQALASNQSQLQSEFLQKGEAGKFRRLVEDASKNNFAGKYQNREKPFWVEAE